MGDGIGFLRIYGHRDGWEKVAQMGMGDVDELSDWKRKEKREEMCEEKRGEKREETGWVGE